MEIHTTNRRSAIQQWQFLPWLLIVMLVGGCTDIADNATVSPLDPWQEQRLIYDVVLATVHSDQAQFVIDEQSYGFNMGAEWLAKSLPTATPETVADFERNNRQQHDLPPIFDGMDAVTLIQPNDFFVNRDPADNADGRWMLEKIFEKERFQRKYRGATGFIRFSVIGFNQERTEAVVMSGLHIEDISGVYHTVLLRKRAGHWTIVEQNESHWIV